ncbi:MAG: PKD domain-containing protein [Flavobacteriales bacterium]|nr:PKD domain-containing protein [Flavobacteriales bacterium]
MKTNLLKIGAGLLTAAVLFATSCTKPAATLTVDTNTVAVGEPVTVEATAEGSIVTIDMGDGTVLTDFRNKFTYTYDQPGTYTILVIASKKSQGDKDVTAEEEIVVTGAMAGISVDNDSPEVGEIITFMSTSTGSASYSWDMGDTQQSPSNSEVVSYSYNQSGTYMVYLTVTDANGTSSSVASVEITVTAPEGTSGFFDGDEEVESMLAGTWTLTGYTVEETRDGKSVWDMGDYLSDEDITSLDEEIIFENNNWSFDGYVVDADGNNRSEGQIFRILNSTQLEWNNSLDSYDWVNGGIDIHVADSEGQPAFVNYTVSESTFEITYTSTGRIWYDYDDYEGNWGDCNCYTDGDGDDHVVTTTITFTR